MKRKKRYGIEMWPAPSDDILKDWHICDDAISKHLKRAVNPPPSFNGGKPTWFVTLLIYGGGKDLPINYCPVCGEKLPEVKRQPMAYGGQP